jgi:hypothetical protein
MNKDSQIIGLRTVQEMVRQGTGQDADLAIQTCSKLTNTMDYWIPCSIQYNECYSSKNPSQPELNLWAPRGI